MALSAAEKNRRKRERKKREREERRKLELEEKEAQAALLENGGGGGKEEGDDDGIEIEIEIEYVSEDLSKILHTMKTETQKENANDIDDVAPPQTTTTTTRPDGLPPLPGSKPEKDNASETDKDTDNSIEDVLRRFHQRAALVPSVSDGNDEESNNNKSQGGDQSSVVSNDYSSDDDDDDDEPSMSKRKLRELIRPTVAELKRRVQRPDLVEAHDVTAADPDFLIALKGIPHTTPVPFHWGRKRKYLQGKRGMDKVPFKLPDFIIKTGIANVRDTAMEDEANQSAKQKNRGRINPKMGTMDVDYKVLYDAFFKYQTKPTDLTSWGDLYYEGKEMENSTDIKPGGPFSKALKIALGMGGDNNNTPPPWLWNMQRYGPPPGHQKLKIPGLNAPLPNNQCQYGYHPGGWGKPPVDAYGRPLYGGNPLDPPGSGDGRGDDDGRELVTSDGKTVLKSEWGGLPTGEYYPGQDGGDENDNEDSDSDMEDSSSDDDSGSESGEDMEQSDDEGAKTTSVGGTESVLPPPPSAASSGIVDDLRKQSTGDETPAPPPKRLYQVLETGAEGGAAGGAGSSGIFGSDVRYVVPGATATTMAAPVPEGAESVLSKAVGPSQGGDGDGPGAASRKKRKHNPQDDETDELEKNFKF
jgi:splicing factor 3B subunit 2